MARDLVTVVQASFAGGYRLRLRFSDGTRKTVDFTPWLRGKAFVALRDAATFKKFFVSGGTVCWPNGADIAPETLRAATDVSASAA